MAGSPSRKPPAGNSRCALTDALDGGAADKDKKVEMWHRRRGCTRDDHSILVEGLRRLEDRVRLLRCRMLQTAT